MGEFPSKRGCKLISKNLKISKNYFLGAVFLHFFRNYYKTLVYCIYCYYTNMMGCCIEGCNKKDRLEEENGIFH